MKQIRVFSHLGLIGTQPSRDPCVGAVYGSAKRLFGQSTTDSGAEYETAQTFRRFVMDQIAPDLDIEAKALREQLHNAAMISDPLAIQRA